MKKILNTKVLVWMTTFITNHILSQFRKKLKRQKMKKIVFFTFLMAIVGGVPHPKFSPYERIQHLISIYPKNFFGFHEF